MTALLELEHEAVAAWAKEREKPVTTYAALALDEDVQRLIGEQVEAANAGLDEAARVRALRDHAAAARRRAARSPAPFSARRCWRATRTSIDEPLRLARLAGRLA